MLLCPSKVFECHNSEDTDFVQEKSFGLKTDPENSNKKQKRMLVKAL